jgi:signal transduction histidine kinase
MASPWVTRSLGPGILIALVGVAAATALIYPLREVTSADGAAIIYLLPILLVSIYWGPLLGVASSILSAAALEFFHLSSTYSFNVETGEDWVALAAFLVVALVSSVVSGRARELAEEQEALRRVAVEVAQARSAAEIFETVTREVGLQSGADLARMERYESDGTVTGVAAWSRREDPELAVGRRFALEGASIAARVRETGRPVRVDSFADETGPIAEEARALGISSSVGCPIVVDGRVWGVIAASSKGEKAFPGDTETRIAEFTELVATAIANAESREELIASRARVVAAADEARRRIQRNLHDGAQQRLVNATITLKLAKKALDEGDPKAESLVDEALDHSERATEELRELSHGLLPSVLARGGLRAGVDSLVSRMPLPVETDVCDERFAPQIEASAYFIVSEALTNVVKHAGAGRASVRADADGGLLRVEVRDDGAGAANMQGGSGLVGLHDRVAALEGKFEIESPPGEGTRVVATLPVARANDSVD